MGKSIKRTPIIGNCGDKSEKYDKQLANRAFRRRVKVALISDKEPVSDVRAVSNVWDFAKDGKHYMSKSTLEKYPQFMRK